MDGRRGGDWRCWSLACRRCHFGEFLVAREAPILRKLLAKASVDQRLATEKLPAAARRYTTFHHNHVFLAARHAFSTPYGGPSPSRHAPMFALLDMHNPIRYPSRTPLTL